MSFEEFKEKIKYGGVFIYLMFSIRAALSHKKRDNDAGGYLLYPHKAMLEGMRGGNYFCAFPLIACCAVTAVLLVVDIPLFIVKDVGGALKGKISAFISKEKSPETQSLLKCGTQLPSDGLQAKRGQSGLPQQGGEKGTSVEFRSSSTPSKKGNGTDRQPK